MAKAQLNFGELSGGGSIYKIKDNLEILADNNTYTVDASGVPNYQRLTEDNFILSLNTVKTVASGTSTYTNTLTKSYNTSTGTLTITGYPMSGSSRIYLDVLAYMGCEITDISGS